MPIVEGGEDHSIAALEGGGAARVLYKRDLAGIRTNYIELQLYSHREGYPLTTKMEERKFTFFPWL